MKYVTFSFDDGRKDNFEYAFPILEKYGFHATLFCTTGYIDRSWNKPDSWHSAGEPISIDNLFTLKEHNWEIALHGDRHITDTRDCINSLNKFNEWGFGGELLGFSMPNSLIDIDKFDKFKIDLLNKRIMYIRKGRRIDTKKISSRVLFGLYSYLNLQFAYNKFNSKNINSLHDFDNSDIASVVIRFNDKPDMISNFIENMPDESWCVFMLHSILPYSDSLYGSDPWNWECNKFDELCQRLSLLSKDESICVDTIENIYRVLNS